MDELVAFLLVAFATGVLVGWWLRACLLPLRVEGSDPLPTVCLSALPVYGLQRTAHCGRVGKHRLD